MKRQISLVHFAKATVLAMLAMLASSLLADGEDALADLFDYYRENVSSKESGVYEHDGTLFVHAKVPFDRTKPSIRNKAKLEASLLTGKLLKDWAIDFTAADRKAAEKAPEAALYAKTVLDADAPGWQFPEWTATVPGCRTLADRSEGGAYVISLAADKDKIAKAIPVEFRQLCPLALLSERLTAISSRRLSSSGRDKFLVKCGAFDFISTNEMAASSNKEYSKINADIGRYLKKSAFASALRREMAEMARPSVTTNHSYAMNKQGTKSVERKEVVTVTIFPRMQKLFLEYSSETNFPTERLESGTEAVRFARDRRRQASEKIAVLKEALSESPGDKELWNYLGLIMMNGNDLLGAVICFRNALKLDHDYGYPVVNLAKAYAALGAKHLAWGTAIVALGTSSDSWCRTESHKLLELGAPSLLPDSKQKSKAVDVQAPVSTPKPQGNDAGAARPAPGKQDAKGFASGEVDTDLVF